MGTNYLADVRYIDKVGGVAPAVVQAGVDGEAAKIWEGAMVCLLASGYAVRAGTAATGPVQGVAQNTADNSASGAADGAVSVNLLQGAFWFPNSADDPVTIASLGKVVYAYDDQTICGTSGGGAKPISGTLLALDADKGCLVYISSAQNRVYSDLDLESNLADTSDGKGASLVAIEDDGNFTAQTNVEEALQEIYQALESAQGRVPLNVVGATKADGTALAKFSAANDGTCGIYGDGTKVLGVRWNNTAGSTDTIACPPVMVPPDADLTKAMYIKIKAAKVGATLADAVTFACGVYAQTEAALYDAGANLGATSGAMTGDSASKTVQLVSATITAPASAAQGLTVTINPTAAKLTTDDVMITHAWIQYTKKLPTA